MVLTWTEKRKQQQKMQARKKKKEPNKPIIIFQNYLHHEASMLTDGQDETVLRLLQIITTLQCIGLSNYMLTNTTKKHAKKKCNTC